MWVDSGVDMHASCGLISLREALEISGGIHFDDVWLHQ